MVKKRGLGKSLDALLVGSSAMGGEEGRESPATNEKLCHIPVDLISRGKYQPRRNMAPAALDELAQSIKAQGVIQPIVVRHQLGGRYEIVAGERRWRAAQMAGLKEIPAIVKEIPDEAAVAIALIENIQRESLNPIEEALALQRLLNEFSMTHQAVAEAVGKSRASVTNLLRLLALSDEVKTMVERGELEMGHARALLALPPSLQTDAAHSIVEKALSVRQTEDLVRALQSPPLPNTPKSIDPDILKLQQDLTTRLQMMVKIRCNAKGRGRVMITYKNLTELDKILACFS